MIKRYAERKNRALIRLFIYSSIRLFVWASNIEEKPANPIPLS